MSSGSRLDPGLEGRNGSGRHVSPLADDLVGAYRGSRGGEMSRIFISHSSADNAAAVAVSRWLEEEGWSDLFLDISPARGLTPGERWQETLKSAADRCEAVLFLISSAWRDSRWCLAEFLLAKCKGARSAAVMGPFLLGQRCRVLR
jgi:hypothetical protein